MAKTDAGVSRRNGVKSNWKEWPDALWSLQGEWIFNVLACLSSVVLSCSCVLQATAPFLHIGALAVVTALSWLIAGQFARTEKASEYHLCPCVLVRGWWVAGGSSCWEPASRRQCWFLPWAQQPPAQPCWGGGCSPRVTWLKPEWLNLVWRCIQMPRLLLCGRKCTRVGGERAAFNDAMNKSIQISINLL